MWSRKISKCVFDNTIGTTSKISLLGVWNSSRFIQSNKEVQDPNQPSTIDPSEVKMFSKYLNEWWDEKGVFALIHRLNPMRVPFVRDGLAQCPTEQKSSLPLKNRTILDVGCGGGILTEDLAKLGAKVTGIDASKELIQVAQEHSRTNPELAHNLPTYHNTTIEVYSKQYRNHYDAVVVSEVIEHVNNQELFAKCCIDTVKPGGKVFFTTPNRTWVSQFLVIFLAEDVLGLAPKGAHQYEKFVTMKELGSMLARNNCQVELTHGVLYNPITRKWYFSKYEKMWYAIQARKLC
ncbi:ubiquinone biosynthesis O-methyltransferase, mitochondrial-like [Anticarsia gemmatalis]|uniref:ubiquinone biosynthesis O-methyltransferase, mitochondrial-like n=1 Tax=Anticarsia gemmatalis TaxID=129554 RepID=UPI003F76804D